MRRAVFSLALAVLFVTSPWPHAVRAQEQDSDRHSEYYYPVPQSRELYRARAPHLPRAGRATRIGFVTGLSQQMTKRAYPPSFAIFAKGAEAEKLIIVALDDGPLDTLYRARAVLADLTSMARLLPILREFGVEDRFTFLDLSKMLGFVQVTVSDGRDFAHQITVDAPE